MFLVLQTTFRSPSRPEGDAHAEDCQTCVGVAGGQARGLSYYPGSDGVPVTYYLPKFVQKIIEVEKNIQIYSYII